MTLSALRRHTLILTAAMGFLSLSACKQTLGDPCQVSSDCGDGLVCVLPVGGTPQVGGTCQPPEGLDMGIDQGVSTDAASTNDLATDDASTTTIVDLATTPDAS